MTSHIENNKFLRISVPQIGCDLDRLESSKVQALIQEVFRSTNIEIIVYLKPLKEPPRASQASVDSFDNAVATETTGRSEPLNSLASSQRANPALKNHFHYFTRGTPPSTQELQGLPQSTWQLADRFRSSKIFSDVLFREFVHKGRPPHYQPLIPASLVPHVLTWIHSSPTGGHLAVFKTFELVRERFYWPGFQEDLQLFFQSM